MAATLGAFSEARWPKTSWPRSMKLLHFGLIPFLQRVEIGPGVEDALLGADENNAFDGAIRRDVADVLVEFRQRFQVENIRRLIQPGRSAGRRTSRRQFRVGCCSCSAFEPKPLLPGRRRRRRTPGRAGPRDVAVPSTRPAPGARRWRPTGCPSAIEPPLTLSFSRGTSPSFLSTASTCAAKASLISIRSASAKGRPAFRMAETGPRPMRAGSQPV